MTDDTLGSPHIPDTLTFGEKAVGLTFNPSGDERVLECKHAFADIIDALHALRTTAGPGEVSRLASVAITEAQTAQMWAVKALTWVENVDTTSGTRIG